MSKITIGVVDYGVGNQTSVRQAFHKLKLRCRVTDDTSILNACDLLVLPGVGAFQPALRALKLKGLDQFLLERAREQKPILGICLGMQLLTESSMEHGYCKGLGLIPGDICPIGEPRWHIGWNTVECVGHDPLFETVNSQSFYFNHSYVYKGSNQYVICKSYVGVVSFASVIRYNLIVGIQFHPEKSQVAGHTLLGKIVAGLCDA